MSFGLDDKTWVDPDDDCTYICANCDHWRECPRKPDIGWCLYWDDFTDHDETCGDYNA